jgi:hypothetical protein
MNLITLLTQIAVIYSTFIEEEPCAGTITACTGGYSAQFKTCDNGRWVIRDCGPGTVCLHITPGVVSCGDPYLLR